MQVKRFVAADMRRALELVRQEVGPAAIILSSGRVPEGVELLTTTGTDNELIQLQQQPLGKLALASASPMLSDGAWAETEVIERAAKQHMASVKPSVASHAEANEIIRKMYSNASIMFTNQSPTVREFLLEGKIDNFNKYLNVEVPSKQDLGFEQFKLGLINALEEFVKGQDQIELKRIIQNIKHEPKKENKEVIIEILGKEAYNKKKTDPTKSWIKIGKETGKNIRTARKYAFAYAQKINDNTFIDTELSSITDEEKQEIMRIINKTMQNNDDK